MQNGSMYQPFMNCFDMKTEISMIGFKKELSDRFRDLNIAWLEKYFYVEPIDHEMLSNPAEYIINKGGFIFFAKYGGDIVGTFALMPIENGVFELGKMAVDENYQGKKVGNIMLEFCLQKAKELNAHKVILYSNTKLEPAIHLYRKFGFKEIPSGNTIYKRSNIKMERNINNEQN